jgi:hypothetical protein
LAQSREEYEDAVRGLSAIADRLKEGGQSEEQIARHLVGARNAIKYAFRKETEPALLAWMQSRNLAKYGDPLGPTAETQLIRYGSWDEVIKAACRPANLNRTPF